ncbi:recombinase [Bifidobacterium pseudolongum subsp. globosum]|nr:IS607 family transposase [Bifidobacterium pseudolongum]RYQ44225.1 recombinase [Bifidobacterium pseudolongum subsp. globosum]
MTYFGMSEFLRRTGVSKSTAYRAEAKGVITPTRTTGGHRRYTEEDVAKLLGLQKQNAEKKCVVYCRVSSNGQKADLESQKQAMMDFATARGYTYDVVEEIGGGMNMNRPKFMRIVNGIISGEIGTVIVAHKDRLARFGYDLVQNLADEYGAEIIVANREDMSPQQEMVEDLMAIVHTYSCRLYGLRRYRKASDLIGKDGI